MEVLQFLGVMTVMLAVLAGLSWLGRRFWWHGPAGSVAVPATGSARAPESRATAGAVGASPADPRASEVPGGDVTADAEGVGASSPAWAKALLAAAGALALVWWRRRRRAPRR